MKPPKCTFLSQNFAEHIHCFLRLMGNVPFSGSSLFLSNQCLPFSIILVTHGLNPTRLFGNERGNSLGKSYLNHFTVRLGGKMIFLWQTDHCYLFLSYITSIFYNNFFCIISGGYNELHTYVVMAYHILDGLIRIHVLML